MSHNIYIYISVLAFDYLFTQLNTFKLFALYKVHVIPKTKLDRL